MQNFMLTWRSSRRWYCSSMYGCSCGCWSRFYCGISTVLFSVIITGFFSIIPRCTIWTVECNGLFVHAFEELGTVIRVRQVNAVLLSYTPIVYKINSNAINNRRENKIWVFQRHLTKHMLLLHTVLL